MEHENESPSTTTPKIKPIDWNKLVSKEKRRAFYAGRIYQLRDFVNVWHPFMSEELLEALLGLLEGLTQTKRELAKEQKARADALSDAPSIPNMRSNPFYKEPIIDLPFMGSRKTEEITEEVGKVETSVGESR